MICYNLWLAAVQISPKAKEIAIIIIIDVKLSMMISILEIVNKNIISLDKF